MPFMLLLLTLKFYGKLFCYSCLKKKKSFTVFKVVCQRGIKIQLTMESVFQDLC